MLHKPYIFDDLEEIYFPPITVNTDIDFVDICSKNNKYG